jgi:TonB family protein
MRRIGLTLALLAMTAGTVWAQELPPTKSDTSLDNRAATPVPDKNGVYTPGPGIMLPLIIRRAPANYPPDAAPETINGASVLSLVVGADGVPADIQVDESHGAAFDAAAIEAVKQSEFDPGRLDGRQVPVRVFVRVRYFADGRPAFPRVFARNALNGGFMQRPGENAARPRPFDNPPIATYAPNASYSEEARRKKIQGVVMVSLLVTEDGLPTDIRVEKSAGYGLDEKAVESVSQYKFKPALKDGAPIAARITVEVSFRLY